MAASKPERRAEPRSTVAIAATVYNIHQGFLGKCVIRDASRSGCRLFSNAAHRFPDRVLLMAQGIGDLLEAEVMWKDGRAVGLRFVNRGCTQSAGPTGTDVKPPVVTTVARS